MSKRLLVVDDDQRLRDLLKKYLSGFGFHVDTASNAANARQILQNQSFDLIILDIMMPDETGLEFLDTLRDSDHIGKVVPVLMLTAMGEVGDRISGLEKGADDYLGKPFDPKELLLRVQTILKRANPAPAQREIIALGDKIYDMHRQTLYCQDTPISLSTVETNLLHILAQYAGSLISRDELALRSGVALSPRTVDVQVTRLRRKIECDPKNPYYLRTIRHKGYILWPDSQ